jgi:hypothetical protein
MNILVFFLLLETHAARVVDPYASVTGCKEERDTTSAELYHLSAYTLSISLRNGLFVIAVGCGYYLWDYFLCHHIVKLNEMWLVGIIWCVKIWGEGG